MPSRPVNINLDTIALSGDLFKPAFGKEQKNRLVVFAHGSGSSRLSPRNRFVAKVLQDKGFGTLLFDLLTEEEDQDYQTRFDIELLTERLEKATNWVVHDIESDQASIGYFGASTGAAAALIAASKLGSKKIKAVVSRGGRVDMAEPYLRNVVIPTLLIVGGKDEDVLELNRSALKVLSSSTKELVVVQGATHLFEEPRALEEVAEHATRWFLKYL